MTEIQYVFNDGTKLLTNLHSEHNGDIQRDLQAILKAIFLNVNNLNASEWVPCNCLSCFSVSLGILSGN